MRRFFFLAIGLLTWQAGAAQKMRDVFAAMPDSLLEIMTRNNRLDCIDFIEHDMEARVRNRFDGFTSLRAMTLDYLDLQLTERCRVEMNLLPAEDSLNYICMVRTYAGPARESTVTLYTPEWQRVPQEEWLRQGPDYAAFWKTGSDPAGEAEIARLQHLQDMRFVTASLQPDDMRLTFALQPGEVTREDSLEMEKILRPLTYEWDGRHFVPVKTNDRE